MKTKIQSAFLLLLLLPFAAAAQNQSITSFNKAKKTLERQIYQEHRMTLYCGAQFDAQKKISLPKGFATNKHFKRAYKVEWEHVVPAENFGRVFKEWRDGDSKCINSQGKPFKGRRCAEKLNKEYRYMQADMFNLYPAIGAVNAMRSNYNLTLLPDRASSFGSCQMKIHNKQAEPPAPSRGRIARTYLYMDKTYSRYKMSQKQRQLMEAWDKTFPVDSWECKRARKITQLQESENLVVKTRCAAKGLWL